MTVWAPVGKATASPPPLPPCCEPELRTGESVTCDASGIFAPPGDWFSDSDESRRRLSLSLSLVRDSYQLEFPTAVVLNLFFPCRRMSSAADTGSGPKGSDGALSHAQLMIPNQNNCNTMPVTFAWFGWLLKALAFDSALSFSASVSALVCVSC